jgi:hypothetical protein
MQSERIDSVFRIIVSALGRMKKHQVAEAFALLDGISGPNLDEWSLSILRGYEALREAWAHAQEAERLSGEGHAQGARSSWNAARQAALRARDTQRMERHSPAGEMTTVMPDCWPQVVDAFEEVIRERRRASEAGA